MTNLMHKEGRRKESMMNNGYIQRFILQIIYHPGVMVKARIELEDKSG